MKFHKCISGKVLRKDKANYKFDCNTGFTTKSLNFMNLNQKCLEIYSRICFFVNETCKLLNKLTSQFSYRYFNYLNEKKISLNYSHDSN